jgi:AcrR family transcriptional regulator
MNVRSNKRAIIFDAALELIATHGLHNTPMSLVSKVSGVSTGAIYHHFESKETLINELYIFLKKAMHDSILAGFDTGDYKEGFAGIWSNYFHFLIQNPNMLSFIEQCSTAPIIKETTRQQAAQYINPLITFIQQGIGDGMLKPHDFNFIMAIINGNVTAMAKLHISRQLIITQEIEEQAIEATWKSLSV